MKKKTTQKRGRTIDFAKIDTVIKKNFEQVVREEMQRPFPPEVTKPLRAHDVHQADVQRYATMDKKIPAYGPDDDAFWGQPDQTTEPEFDSFIGEIKQLFGKSVSKGYGPMQPDDPNPLYNFMLTFFSNDHALGEIIYKAIRYRNKRNPEDLVKIAAWAWLVWMHHWRKESELGN